MIGEYGYMEEGKLGKPYDLRLLKRLARYAIPHRKTVSTALLLTILITLLDLAAPYLTKVAIDRYIISAWYRVHLTDRPPHEVQNPLEHYDHLMKERGWDFSLHISGES